MNPATDTTQLHILLVDDQPIIAHGVRQLLASESDMVLHYCQYPREAFDKAREVGATLILQDLTMPDIDGITLVRFFRNHPTTRTLPIIILSGKDSPRDKVEGFKAGANDYLVKLPEKTEFIARIRAHVTAYRRANAVMSERDELKNRVESMASELETLHREIARLTAALEASTANGSASNGRATTNSASEADAIAEPVIDAEPMPAMEHIDAIQIDPALFADPSGDLHMFDVASSPSVGGSHRDQSTRRHRPSPSDPADDESGSAVVRASRQRGSSSRAPRVPGGPDRSGT